MADLSPYSTAKALFGVAPTWLPAEDAERIQAYALYEGIYRNVPEAFRVVQRGSEQNPIYIPSGKTIIEACNRFLAKRWDFSIVPEAGTPEQRAELSAMLTALFVREQVHAKFATQKKWGLIRGDAVWHVTADLAKEAGTRISIHEIDPASYFPIHDPVDDSKVIGVHLVDQFDVGDTGAVVVRRQTYRKDPETRRISYEVTWWETTGWDDREGSGQTLKKAEPPPSFSGVPAFELPPEITVIPVYHTKNERTPGAPFGVSELAGLERVIAGITQAISDEELALALEGLGLYTTDSGAPVNDEGEEVAWNIGPGRVVEHDAASEFKRISGISTVQPVQDHVAYLDRALRDASGTPDIAIGKVDGAVAESGVSLALQMSPLIAKNEDKEQLILGTMDHLLHDLVTMWLPAYEGLTTDARAVSIVEDPLPLNRKEVLEEIVMLLGNNIISIEYAQILVAERLGYEFPEGMLDAIVTEQGRVAGAQATTDPVTARLAAEMDAAGL